MALTALDYEEIKQLHARYSHSIDFQDAEGLLTLFARDAVFDGPEQRWQGEQQLREFGKQVGENTLGHVRHSVLYSLIEGDGDQARSLSLAMITRDFGPPEGRGQTTHSAVLTGGVYDDDLVKVSGKWRYATRRFRHDGWPGTLGRLRQPLQIGHVDTTTGRDNDISGLSALDYEAIRQLLARYSYTLDFEDYDGFVGCFTEDGSFEALTSPSMGGIVKSAGVEGLREFAMTVGSAVRGHARHSSVSVIIEGDGEQARVTQYSLIPMDYGTPRQPKQRDNATVGTSGIYRDEVVKVDGRWLFKRRTFRYDGWPDVLAMRTKPVSLRPFGDN